MTNYDLPFGLSRRDTMTGTVTRTNRVGIDVVLDVDDPNITEVVKAFVRCEGEVGQRVLVTLQYFNKKRGNFFATLDGVLSEGPANARNYQTAVFAA